jgi:hypothetical protein
MMHLYRPRLLACAGIAVLAGTLAGPAHSASRADGLPPQGTLTRIADMPNHYAAFDPMVSGGPPTNLSFLLVDPVNHLLISPADDNWGRYYPKVGDCAGKWTSSIPPITSFPTEWVTYDIDSYKVKATGCDLPNVDAQASVDGKIDGQTAVVDSTSKLVFVPCICGTSTTVTGRQSIVAVSEETLQPVAQVCVQFMPGDTCTPATSDTAAGSLAQPPYSYLHDLSWYAPTDDLIALTDNFRPTQPYNYNVYEQPSGPLGVAITDYHVSQTGGQTNLVLKWTIHLGPQVCARALFDPLAWTGAAYRSEDPSDPALFVPCTSQTGPAGPAGTVVVKVPLQGDGRPAGDPAVDPAAKIQAVTAPFVGQDFIFDPRAERGLLLPQELSTTGLTVAVYDGGHGRQPSSFLGRIEAGHSKYNAYAIDPNTGRVYVDDALVDGLTLIDGRRNPITPGYVFPSFKTGLPVGTHQAVVVPPDAAYPYTRLIMPNDTYFSKDGWPHVPNFTVIADRVSVSQDPPTNRIDSNTYTGAIPAGSAVSTTYNASASGYGIHSDLVGGYAGPLDNNAPGKASSAAPFGDKQFDVAAGAVEQSALRDGSSQARASSLFDVNGNSAQAYHACSDPSSPQSCAPHRACPVPVWIDPNQTDPCSRGYEAVAPATRPSPCPMFGQDPCNTSTAQSWSYPVVECSQPGPKDHEGRQSVSGVNSTSPHPKSSSDPPTQSKLPQSEGTTAVADCSNGQVTATAQFGCVGVAMPPTLDASSSASVQCDQGAKPLPVGPAQIASNLTVTNARTSTLITPPSGGLVKSAVTSIAQGIHLDLGSGGSVDINQVAQTVVAQAGGRPGTAHTSRRVTLQGVTLAKPGESPTTLCLKPCQGDQALLDILNAFDPAHLYVTLPIPDEPFGPEPDGVSPAGSPGGYMAQVQANQAQQQGDVQFNQMSGFAGTEKTFVAALRMILNDPGDATVNREVIDFAGVEADVQLGVQVVSEYSFAGALDATQPMIQAGVASSGPFGSGSPETVMLPGQSQAAQVVIQHGGLLGVLERAFNGVSWLVRRPLAALQMAAFLLLLGLPVMALRRRWLAGIPTRGK